MWPHVILSANRKFSFLHIAGKFTYQGIKTAVNLIFLSESTQIAEYDNIHGIVFQPDPVGREKLNKYYHEGIEYEFQL